MSRSAAVSFYPLCWTFGGEPSSALTPPPPILPVRPAATHSFGVILFEVLLRKLMLVDEIKNDPRKDAQAYAERVAKGYRPEIPRTWPANLVELIAACWAQVGPRPGGSGKHSASWFDGSWTFSPDASLSRLVPQDPMVRPNFTAVLDVLKEINDAGTIGKLDLTFWSKGSNYI
jgi:hypothetical protein